MELVASVTGAIFAETMRFTCGSVCNRINVTNRFDKNLRAFDTSLPSLKEIRTKVKKVLETMEVKGESVQFQLRKWLEDVEGIVSEATSLEEKRHSSILFLKWRLGYKLSSLVGDIKMLEELGVHLLAGTISKLTSLETLDMSLSSYHWNTKGQAQAHVGHATFEEIGDLTSLFALSVRLVSIPSFLVKVYSLIRRLKRFQIFIGSDVYSLPTRFDARIIKLSSLDVSQVSIGWLLVNATSLVLNNCTGVNDLFKKNLVIEGTHSFDVLKSLTIEGFPPSLGPSGGCMAQLDLFPNLEELHLQHVASETISELFGNLGFRFQRLRLLDISWCSKLACILLVSNLILSLPSLEEIRVSCCERLQELIVYSPGIVEASHEPVLPKLRVIKLKSLSKLKRICNQGEPLECLEQIEVIDCNLLRSLPISSKNADGVKEIRGTRSWFSKLSWDDVTTKVTILGRLKLLDTQSRDDTPMWPRYY